jgi:hypothetical protein
MTEKAHRTATFLFSNLLVGASLIFQHARFRFFSLVIFFEKHVLVVFVLCVLFLFQHKKGGDVVYIYIYIFFFFLLPFKISNIFLTDILVFVH